MSNANQEVALDEVSKKFEAHLNVENNFRIIFSGKYGTGKSFFLNRYFDDRKDTYNKFLISPVNYVVSSNDDIFELIKVDIIKQLFFDGHVQKVVEEDKSDIVKIAQFLHEKSTTPIRHIVSLFSKINPYLTITDSVIKGIEKLAEEYQKYELELQSRLTLSSDYLEDFVNAFIKKPGNIFEEDFITQTINLELEAIKKNGKGSKKKNVLIIDDLDRIDPEHIFRILNILSAHNNHWDKENKFKFDKIILVCDIENIEKTFHHRYGPEVDFGGYVDKFYSTDIFTFSNNDAIKVFVNLGVLSNLSEESRGFLQFVLLKFLDMGTLTLRKIVKSNISVFCGDTIIISRQVSEVVPFIGKDTPIIVRSSDMEFIAVVKVLSMIWGTYESFMIDIRQLQSSQSSLNYGKYRALFDFLILPKHILDKHNKGDLLFIDKQNILQLGSFIHEDKIEFTFPNTEFYGVKQKLELKWNETNIYDGKESYFSDCNIIPFEHSKQANWENVAVSEAYYFNEFMKIVNGFKQLKYLYYIGI